MQGFNQAGHDRGRIETRQATVCRDVEEVRDRHFRSVPEAVVKVTATCETKGKSTTETRRFLQRCGRTGPSKTRIAGFSTSP